ncbi:MAG TPA: ABC transporter substrate-binding protein [Acidimicrobiales bacterium]|nr:ABC transporter substrate-binding protein [Acidimicrobiales bacterium]
MQTRKLMAGVLVAGLLAAACGSGDEDAGGGGGGDGDAVTLVVESWRADDKAVWEDTIIPAFEESHEGIELEFQPTAPTEYNAALENRLDGGEAGDIIACRPFDISLELFEAGHLEAVDDLEGMDAFDDVARSGWVTDDGATTYCVPMASVIHGFYYNKDVFDELGLEPPTTTEDLHTVLDAIAADGAATPIAQGTVDQWDIAEVDYTGIGPNYWKGEEGRQALIDGSAQFTDPEYVAPFEELATWGQYMPDGYEALSYDDAKVLFTNGDGAIFPGGSWEITGFERDAGFELGVFAPPLPTDGDPCYISDHVDIGMGMNADTEHADEARTFLEWVASEEFAQLYSNELPGFFSLREGAVEVDNALADDFVSWRDDCESTIRLPAQKLNRGDPAMWDELYAVSSEVVNGTLTPADAAQRLQEGLDSWYTPSE